MILPPPKEPIRAGYTFTSWSEPFTNISSNVTTTAIYITDTIDEYYTISFKDWDGNILKSELVLFGGFSTPPPTPSRTGYIFNKWDGVYSNITSDSTVNAVYTVYSTPMYTVTFSGAEKITRVLVSYGETAVPPEGHHWEGHRFIGWDGNWENVTSNRTVIGIYEPIPRRYTVSFTGAGKITNIIVEPNGNAIPPSDHHWEGHRFVRWEGDWENVTSNRTVIGIYEPIPVYTVTFTGAGKITRIQTYSGGNVIPPSDHHWEGHRFVRWEGDWENVTSDRTVIGIFEPI